MIYLPPVRGYVRTFIFICAGVYILQYFASAGPFGSAELIHDFVNFFGLVPERVLKGMVFQPLTWVFLHGSIGHVFFNMLTVWMFGSLLEDSWGTRKFFKFCIISGFLTGVIVTLASLFDERSFYVPTIGASGVVYAILVAVSRLYPNQIVLFFFVFPMKLRYFTLLLLVFEFFAFRSGSDPTVSNLAHLSGAAVGFLLSNPRKNSGTGSGTNWIRQLMERWHHRKMRKKLRVIRVNEKVTYH